MECKDYKDCIDFSPLKVTLAAKGFTRKALAEMAGTQDYVINNYIAGRAFPDTEKLAKLCAALQCSVDKVVRFSGYDVKDRFKTPWDGYGAPRWNCLTYEPLRMLFINVYKDDWVNKLTEVYEKIPRPEMSSEKREAIEKMKQAKAALIQEKIEKGEYKGAKNNYRTTGVGLLFEIRTKISQDKPIPLPRLYDICKALHCTPDWVMTYN